MFSFNRPRLTAFASSLALLTSFSVSALDIQPIGEIQIGQGEGYAEMLRYHAGSQSLVVTASETGTIERISIATPSALSLMSPFDLEGGRHSSCRASRPHSSIHQGQAS